MLVADEAMACQQEKKIGAVTSLIPFNSVQPNSIGWKKNPSQLSTNGLQIAA